jgi:hypothetical protein
MRAFPVGILQRKNRNVFSRGWRFERAESYLVDVKLLPNHTFSDGANGGQSHAREISISVQLFENTSKMEEAFNSCTHFFLSAPGGHGGQSIIRSDRPSCAVL